MHDAAAAARFVADELNKAAERLTRAQGIAEPTTKRTKAKYDAIA